MASLLGARCPGDAVGLFNLWFFLFAGRPRFLLFLIVCFFRLPFSLGCLLLRDRSARTPALRALTLYLPSLPQFAVSCYLPSALRSSAP